MPDQRFAKLKNDPRFKRPRKRKNKVVIDERFSAVLEKDNAKKTVDKYGRPVSRSRETENLKRFYRIDGAEAQPDYARGEGLVESSDEESDRESEPATSDSQPNDLLLVKNGSRPPKNHALQLTDDQAMELDAQVKAFAVQAKEEIQPPVESTSRFAVVNLDWDHIKASDLFRIISSVLSQDSSGFSSQNLLSVRIYPSEFGKDRLRREELEGPPPEVFSKASYGENIQEDSDGIVQEEDFADYNEEPLRTYQLERLRYYYAIASFDSKRACAYVYGELEGSELERSANILDLSYVPNDMTFEDGFRDECTGDTLPAAYKGLDFATDALRHSKVKLTWEEDDPDRVNLTRRTLSRQELETTDFRAYLASSETDSTQSEDETKQKLRNLLLKGDGSDGQVWDNKHDRNKDMEITFTPGVVEQGNNDNDETTLDRYKRRQRERRLERKVKLASRKDNRETNPDDGIIHPQVEQMTNDSGSEEIKHFDMTSIIKYEKLASSKGKHKRKQKAKLLAKDPDLQDDFVLDASDERFAPIYMDHQFALDPSSSQFRPSRNMKNLLGHHQQSQSPLNGTGQGPQYNKSKKRRIG